MQLIRAVACVVVGPLYALQSDSVLGVGLGLLVTGVGAFLVLDEFGWGTAGSANVEIGRRLARVVVTRSANVPISGTLGAPPAARH